MAISRWLALAAVGWVACDGGSTNSTNTTSTPQTKCELFVRTVCKRFVECVPGSFASQKACEQGGIAATCSRVMDVSAMFSACVDDIEGLSCSSLFPAGQLATPASCRGVLVLAKTPEETKCLALQKAVCGAFVDCLMSSTPQDDRLLCEEDFDANVPCSEVTSVGPTYDKCMADLKTATCTMGQLDLPGSCKGVL